MDLTLKQIKEKMARLGYYNASDFAKLKGITRQAAFASLKEGRVSKTNFYERDWIKYDNGQHGLSIYGVEQTRLTPFVNFGFKARLKSLVVGDQIVCDVKFVQNNTASIRFYNQNGDMLSIFADLNTIEIINDVPDSI